MSNLKIGTVVGVAACIALIVGVLLGSLTGGGFTAGGGVENDNPIFSRGLRAGQPAVQEFNAAGAFVGQFASATSLTLGGGTAISSYKCTSATWNPASVSSSSASQTLAINTGASTVGDIVIPSLASATSTNLWLITAKVTASGATNGTTTIFLRGQEGAAVDLSTTTAKVCIIR